MFWETPYGVPRHPVLAENVIATSQPLAAQAGLKMLAAGGNAVDAALAAAIALAVVEPVSNGLGSDVFAIVWDGHKIHALNASGRAPAAWNEEFIRTWRAIPQRGWHSVTVPGAVAAWADLSARFGRLPFETLFEPAQHYAFEGFPVSPSVAHRWRIQVDELRAEPGFAEAFLLDGRAPAPGDIFRQPDLGRSLQRIAETGGETFYTGELAERIAAHAKECGGLMSVADLANHRNEWCDTVNRRFLGCDVHEMPPNSQGLVTLMALGILSHFALEDLAADTADAFHLQIEALKLAFADASRHVAEPSAMATGVDELLDPDYLARRASAIRLSEAQQFGPGLPPEGGTVYLTAADRDGMLVSFIQSNFVGFGSGVVVPGTGISLHNRAAGFTLEPGHPNRVGAGKRPLHTILPALITRGDRPLMSFGVTGGNMQPQGQVQLALRILGRGQNPQTAIDAPRFRLVAGLEINIEPGMPNDVTNALASRGHQIMPLQEGYMDFGSAQIAYRLEDCWLAATDGRKDGSAIGC